MKQKLLILALLLGPFFGAKAQVAIDALNDACEPIDISIDAYYFDGNNCSVLVGAASGTIPAHTSPVPMTFFVPSTDPFNAGASFNTYAVTFTVCDGTQGATVVADISSLIPNPCVTATGNYGFQIGCTVDPECSNPPNRSLDLEVGGPPHANYLIHYH